MPTPADLAPGRLFHVTASSSNRKTGPIPVTTTDRGSCPSDCPLAGAGCYADGGPLRMHWTAVGTPKADGGRGRGIPFAEFLARVRSFALGTWRHNQAGDLPANGAGTIDADALAALASANGSGPDGSPLPSPRPGFTYTHHALVARPGKPERVAAANRRAVAAANRAGFTVNASAETLAGADALAATGCAPVVALLPADTTDKVTRTPAGRRVVTCPATLDPTDTFTCSGCGSGRPLCARSDRDYIVGFPAHGSSTRKADALARG